MGSKKAVARKQAQRTVDEFAAVEWVASGIFVYGPDGRIAQTALTEVISSLSGPDYDVATIRARAIAQMPAALRLLVEADEYANGYLNGRYKNPTEAAMAFGAKARAILAAVEGE